MPSKTATATIVSPHSLDNEQIKVVAHYGFNDTFLGQDPYISVTGELYNVNHRGYTSHEPFAVGQVVNEMEQAFPWLKPLMQLHLSSVPTGAPPHALDNGWYYLAGQPGYKEQPQITDESRITAAEYLRTTPEMLADITTKDELRALIDTHLAPAWRVQLASTLALFGFDEFMTSVDLDSINLIYTNENDQHFYQPLSDLPTSGGLVDPDTGDDLDLFGYELS